MIARLCRQCYLDMMNGQNQAQAFHTAKRLFEQLTGSIDQFAVQRAIFPPNIGGTAHRSREQPWIIEDAGRAGMVDWG